VCVCVCVWVLLLLLFKETRRRRRTKKGNIMHNLRVYIYIYIYNFIYNIHHIYKSFHFGNPKSDVKPEWFMFTGIYCGWTLLDSAFRSQMSSAERDFFNFPPVRRSRAPPLLSIAAHPLNPGNRSSPPLQPQPQTLFCFVRPRRKYSWRIPLLDKKTTKNNKKNTQHIWYTYTVCAHTNAHAHAHGHVHRSGM